jgi:hypothetical protein
VVTARGPAQGLAPRGGGSRDCRGSPSLEQTTEKAEATPTMVFVYGTLKRGFPNHQQPATAEDLLPSSRLPREKGGGDAHDDGVRVRHSEARVPQPPTPRRLRTPLRRRSFHRLPDIRCHRPLICPLPPPRPLLPTRLRRTICCIPSRTR